MDSLYWLLGMNIRNLLQRSFLRACLSWNSYMEASMKSLLVTLILLFPLTAYAQDPCTSAWFTIVHGIEEDRDNGVPIQKELLVASDLLTEIHMLNSPMKSAMDQTVRIIYSSSVPTSTLANLFIENCEEQK